MSATAQAQLADLAGMSRRLRKERELACYGDLDFIPTEEYSREDARKAEQDVQQVLQATRRVIRPGS